MVRADCCRCHRDRVGRWGEEVKITCASSVINNTRVLWNKKRNVPSNRYRSAPRGPTNATKTPVLDRTRRGALQLIRRDRTPTKRYERDPGSPRADLHYKECRTFRRRRRQTNKFRRSICLLLVTDDHENRKWRWPVHVVQRVPWTGAAGLDEGRGTGLVRRRAVGPTRIAGSGRIAAWLGRRLHQQQQQRQQHQRWRRRRESAAPSAPSPPSSRPTAPATPSTPGATVPARRVPIVHHRVVGVADPATEPAVVGRFRGWLHARPAVYDTRHKKFHRPAAQNSQTVRVGIARRHCRHW